MSVEIAKAFMTATIEVLSTMAMITPKAGKPFVKKDNAASGDVTGLIGLTGDKTGTVSVTFTQKCALSVVKSMLGDDIQDVIQDTKDMVGEITNMISGKARQILAGDGLTMQAATPSVIMGKNHTVHHVSSEPIMAIPFTTDHGEFSVEFCFE
ncbi:chemotaxis protein CheX [Desulfonatronum thioautotrophicum]|uniref:chemotaxis protein CheX n=1 Tax=Desulfonatronum thioautotrophicum TaxID=617001 RepID=UPI0005EB0862|nr:chemotaxis protein CheX [Desulfonatronum thioautotrophicum]